MIQLVTFCMGLKNRSREALQSIENLVTPTNAEFFKFTIVEDQSDSLLDLSLVKHPELIKYHLVITKDSWNRSKVLNYGGRRVKTQYVAFWDADFIFRKSFTANLMKLLEDIEKVGQKYIIAIECYESADGVIACQEKRAGQRYGRLWIYPTEAFKEVRGFDEKFIGWGKEERDLEQRVHAQCKIKTFYTWKKRPALFIKHRSHDDTSRGINFDEVTRNVKLKATNKKYKRYVVNNEDWGLLYEVKK